MTFNKTFCPSPWFHMRINNSGTYEFCRWSKKESLVSRHDLNDNINEISPLEYFKNNMRNIRTDILNGTVIPKCNDCVVMEEHNKVSGRQKQLLKVGIISEYFNKSLLSNTYHNDFVYSATHSGDTTCLVRDWQIDLGNYCNSQCIMCGPASSSRIAKEFKDLGIIDTLPPRAWCDNPVLLNKFIVDLAKCSNIEYLHFIGGETLIVPGFRKILQAVIDAGLASNITVGFTTNLTVPPSDVIDLLSKFKQVNLGISIEAIDPVNDYIRYPSKISKVSTLLDRWVSVGKDLNWLTQIRITPTLLSINHLSTIYDYAWNHNLAVESCNFLVNPAELRINILPKEYREAAIHKLNVWLDNHKNYDTTNSVINTRNPIYSKQQLIQDAQSYVNYLNTAPDESHMLPNTIKFIKRLEQSRGNKITDYLPEYDNLFRSHGY